MTNYLFSFKKIIQASRTHLFPAIITQLFLFALLMIGSFQNEVTDGHLKRMGVARMQSSFSDARVITAGCESYALGFNPQKLNPQHPNNLSFNYPKTWIYLSHIGVSSQHTLLFSILFTLTLSGSIWAINKYSISRANYYVLLFVISPISLLLIERGNNDQLIFAFITIASLSLKDKPFLFASLILLSTVLKLYPVVLFLIPILTLERKKLLIGLGGLMLSTAYFYTIRDQLAEIRNATPSVSGLSYGCEVLQKHFLPESISLRTTQITLIMVLLILVSTLILLKRIKAHKYGSKNSEQILFCFLSGYFIYNFTYLIGANFDYRLVFLVLTFPLLADKCRAQANWSNMTMSYIVIIGSLFLFYDLVLINSFQTGNLTLITKLNVITELVVWIGLNIIGIPIALQWAANKFIDFQSSDRLAQLSNSS